MRRNRLLLCLLCGMLLWAPSVWSEPLWNLERSEFPSLVSSVKISGPLDFCGEAVPLHHQEVRERLEKEILLMLWDRAQVILWMKRSARYMPHIERMLKENRMPEDLKYVPIVESALRPHARSSKGATGFWQFMRATGRKYGLTVNSYKDERRNFFLSTAAAIRYFKELHAMLGSWTLSAAAYNMGEEGLLSEILTQKTNQFYQLYLSLETQRYVLRIIAVKLILTHPKKFGFHLSEADFYSPLEFDRIRLKCVRTTPIHVVAQAANTYFKAIKDLNPEIRGHALQKGRHSIAIPKGSAKGFHARYKTSLKQWLAEKNEQIYVVRKGDNLSAISERFGVPLRALAIWNRLNINKPIYPGQRLVIYPNNN